MGITRINPSNGILGVLDLSDYEFDPGLRGWAQRVYIALKHAGIRLVQGLKFFFTSFLGLHYIYVVSWALILSWILYPEHNMSYTDALFQGVSAVTLTGLNTVNINELKLYQQIFIFIVPLFTHPLTIASFMVFYRVHMYNQKFHDIDIKSKEQSKLRRAATISRFESVRRHGTTRPAETTFQLGDYNEPALPTITHSDSTSPPLKDAKSDYPPSSSSDGRYPGPSPNSEMWRGSYQSSEFPSTQGSGPSKLDSGGPSPQMQENPVKLTDDGNAGIEDGEDEPNKIRFGNLPRPPDRQELNPHEMFRSLNMMRDQVIDDGMDEDDGPALIIKSPRDIEADERRGIHSAVFHPNSASSGHYGRSDEANSSAGAASGGGNRRFSTLSDQGRLGRHLTRTDTSLSRNSSRAAQEMRSNYLSWTPTVGRNSAFIGLTREQKEELGGVEYRALKMLRWFCLAYFVVILCIGWVFLIPWVYAEHKYRDDIRENGVSPVLFAMTTVLSAFNNNGYAVLPSSMGIFWNSAYIPVIVSFIVMAGNVAIPIILRGAVNLVFHLSPKFGQTRESLGFLLDHPRRCFMLLFPAITTAWLFLTLIVFLIVEVALFMILNHAEHSPQPDMSRGLRLLSAYFQSIVVRTVGFTMINVGSQAPGMLVLNTVMMYIAIYPVAMSIRKSNVYEEQTINRYYREPTATRSASSIRSSASSNAIDDDDEDENPEANSSAVHNGNFLRRRLSNIGFRRRSEDQQEEHHDSIHVNRHDENHEYDELDDDDEDNDNPSTLVDHMRRQLSMDIWSLVLGLMLIAIIEGNAITRNEFTLFEVIYEVVSAHGTVGLSTGYRNTTLSLSGGFTVLGKLVMMAIMIRGRHRAMPYNVDRAIILKGSDIRKRDREQEHRVRDARVLVHREPSQSESWLPRVGTAASRLTTFGTQRRRSNHSREEV